MKKLSLSSAPFYTAFAVVISLGILITIVFIVNEYNAFTKHVANIKDQFQEQYRERLREEVDKIIFYITDQNIQTNLQIEKELRQKMQSAYTVASHIYNVFGSYKNIKDIEPMLLEILRPIRWSDGHGFYFFGDMKEMRFRLFSDDPMIEGRGISAVFNEKTIQQDADIVSLVNEKGAGFFEYTMNEPGFPERMSRKLAFVKYFEPLEGFIGAEVYKKGIEEILQADLLERISRMKFGKDGEFFVFRKDGTIIAHSNASWIGRSISDLADETFHKDGNQLLSIGANEPNGSYFEYSVSPDGSNSVNRICFVKPYSLWDWVIGAGISMDDLDKAVSAQAVTYRSILSKNISFFLMLLGVAIVILLIVSYFYSFKIREHINSFTSFFRKAVYSKIKIHESDMIFNEFIELSQLANSMVDDLILYEWHKKQDEIRLNTLLELAGMYSATLQQRYAFVLSKIIQIANSSDGYLAILNSNAQQFDVYTFSEHDMQLKSCPVDVAAFDLSRVRRQENVLICNKSDYCRHDNDLYEHKTERHIDVPFLYDNKVVMIAGVCNSPADYEIADAHQISLILNGLWLQILKTQAESEMLKLERQIIAVSEQERSNIGRDLHDNLCSHLSGIELLMKALEKKAHHESLSLVDQLRMIRTLMKDAIEKARQLAHGLYPVHIAEHGIEAAIESLALEIEQLFHIKCITDFHGHIEWPDHNVSTQLYCIVREAVFNAARHGRPDNISIRCQAIKKMLTVTVQDDGIGFEPDQVSNGLGLHTMRYRAKAIGAVLNIVSVRNQGATITITGEILPHV